VLHAQVQPKLTPNIDDCHDQRTAAGDASSSCFARLVSHFAHDVAVWENFALGFTYSGASRRPSTRIFATALAPAGPPMGGPSVGRLGQLMVVPSLGEIVSQFPIWRACIRGRARLYGKRWAWMEGGLRRACSAHWRGSRTGAAPCLAELIGNRGHAGP